MDALQETFLAEINMYKSRTQDQTATSTDRFMCRIFVEILIELYRKMWPISDEEFKKLQEIVTKP